MYNVLVRLCSPYVHFFCYFLQTIIEEPSQDEKLSEKSQLECLPEVINPTTPDEPASSIEVCLYSYTPVFLDGTYLWYTLYSSFT